MLPKSRHERMWLAGGLIVLALVGLPVLGILATAAEGSGDLWPHLLAHVVPRALRETFLLLACLAVLVITIGAGLAWLVTAYDFPGRKVVEWALLLPLAIPTYIVAYAYVDLLHPVGPLQTAIRGLFAISSPRDLSIGDPRSLTGCIILFALVLYPYVYLATRAVFLMEAASVIEASRMLGSGPLRRFATVAVPLARSAIAVGTSLALMEALNDIGASEFLGVETLSRSIASTWLNRSSLAGASQIAVLLIVMVVSLVMLERWGRRHQRHCAGMQRGRRLAQARLTGWTGTAALAIASVPVILGFVVPASHLAIEAAKRLGADGISSDILLEARNSVGLALVATLVTLALGLVAAYSARVRRGRLAHLIVPAAGLGYAMPGTVVAIGLVVVLAAGDNLLRSGFEWWSGIGGRQMLLGTSFALVYGYAVRFLAIAAGGIEAGLAKIPTSLDEAARTLCCSPTRALGVIHLPLLRSPLAASALLVLVDCMKELPLTLLLRPLGFETLSTHIYGEAARGSYEDGSVAALAIVLTGLIPVLVLARLQMRGGARAEEAHSRPATGRAARFTGRLHGYRVALRRSET